jgi:hypothetical protein
MGIDYYNTLEQQELAFQRYNKKASWSLLDMFLKVNLYWGGGTLFTFNGGTGDKVLFTFLIAKEKKLEMFLDPCNSEARQEFKELARQNISTVKGVLDFLQGDNDSESKSYDLTDDGTGKKYDNGKPMAGTLTDVFSRALMAVGACIEYGTHKYPDPKNWQLVDNGIKRYRDAMVRHLLKYNAGIDKDEETKLPHLVHMAWNALAILELYMQEHKDELDKEIFK